MNWLTKNFELSRGGENANLKSMEGLRGLAVLLVFLVHYVSLAKPWISSKSSTAEIANILHTIGNTGVDLFFVLSGYLIYGSLISRKQTYSNYIYRRIERIYPTFIAVFLLYIYLSFIFPTENKIPPDTSEAALYLIQNFLLLPGLFPIEPMITVAWSLSYEMLYYLAIPIAIQVFHLRNRNQLFRVTFFCLITIVLILYGTTYDGHVRLVMFISGILVFEAMRAGEASLKPTSLVGTLALIFGLLGMLLPINGPLGASTKIVILFSAFGLLCLTCFKSPTSYLARSFCFTPLRWLGNISYSYYLLHGLTLKAIFLIVSNIFPGAVFGPWFFWAFLPIAFLITLPPTVILYLAIERRYSLSRSLTGHVDIKIPTSNERTGT
jgi:exopolysaccharide production protein ExoZ